MTGERKMPLNGGVVAALLRNMHRCVLCSAHMCYQLFLEEVKRLYRNFLQKFTRQIRAKARKRCMIIFSSYGK